jgi:hypothetical protein
MICPLRDNECLEGECAIWADNQCAILLLATRLSVVVPPRGMIGTDSRGILEQCATELGRTSIASLRRREIDDFLASSRVVLDASQRRTLFRTWRDIRRSVREKHIRESDERWIVESSRGNAWSDSEDAELKEWYKAGVSVKTIAAHHKRSEGAIRARLKKHGLLPNEDGTL